MSLCRSRAAATVVTTLTLLTSVLAAPGAAVPIPQDPGAETVVPFLGEPREARPLPRSRFAPRHPASVVGATSTSTTATGWSCRPRTPRSTSSPTPAPARRRIWFVTASGSVGTVNQKTGKVRSRDLGEPIGNSVAVDETVTWRKTYGGGTRKKPGQTQTGSGTTPTIIKRGHRRFVAITDNADPRMHVLVFRAGRAGPGRKPVCQVPVFRRGTARPTTR